MTWQLRSLSDAAAQPWKNGGGRTRELLAWPSPEDWWLRVSVADIEADGPFSAFEGIERWFGVLEGGAVETRAGRAPQRLSPGDPLLRFDGAEAPGCRLLGPTARDLNVMHRRVQGRVTVRPARHGACAPEGFEMAAVFALDPARLGTLALPAWSLAFGPRDDRTLEPMSTGRAWWIGFDAH